MKILSIEFKNFNSYGNKVTKVDFSEKSNMIMLIGQSGHGKSSIREVISYLAYGKVQDKKISDLVNRVNGAMWGKIKMVANKKVIEIERGVNPSIFNVTINGEPLETAGKANIQDELETEYFKIPQSTFDNIISISVDKFKSFLTMRPKDKRGILDQIFGTVFFNKVNDKLKEQLREINIKLDNIEGQVTVLNENKKQIETKIKTLDKDKQVQIKSRLEEIHSLVQTVSEEITRYSQKNTEILEKKSTVENKFKEYRKSKSDLQNEIKNIDCKIHLYDNDKCPECGSDIHTDEHQKNKENLVLKKEELTKSLIQLDDSIKNIEDNSKKINEVHTKLSAKIFDITIQKNNLLSEDKRLSEEQQKINTDFSDVLSSTINKINELLKNLDSLKSDAFVYNELTKLFGEDGIKTQIMKNFLPSFNKNIQEFSRKLHFPYKIVIDEKFDTCITSIGEEINAKTLSTGERKKADFAVLCSLIKVMKRNFPTINLMFADEIFSSLDLSSIGEILTIIKDLSEDMGLTVFTVNHSELPTQFFNYVYEVQKVAGFSELGIKEC